MYVCMYVCIYVCVPASFKGTHNQSFIGEQVNTHTLPYTIGRLTFLTVIQCHIMDI